MRAHSTDVTIVGAGPAGSTLAYLLASDGWHVEILDRQHFPRPKPCGEFVSPGGVRALERLGLIDAVEAQDSARLTGWQLRTEGPIEALGRFSPDGQTAGRGISRAVLDHALVREAVRAGAEFREGVRVSRVHPAAGATDPPRVELIDEQGRRSSQAVRIVVGSDGLRSVVATSLGAIRRGPRLRKLSLTCRLGGPGPTGSYGVMTVHDKATVGVAPVSRQQGLWNGTVVVDPTRYGREVSRDPAEFFQSTLRALGPDWSEDFEVLEGPWASGPFDRPTRKIVTDGVMLVGDAAGYYDPFTGQGIYRAIRSAELAYPVLRQALLRNDSRAKNLRCYERSVRREFRSGRRLQKVIEAALSRSWVRRRTLEVLAANPRALDSLIRVTGDLDAARTLVSPSI